LFFIFEKPAFLENMDWDDFRHFLAVARGGSLTAAARALKSSPATVGRRVAALEKKLGTRLFDRRQNGYSLTESGELVRVKAQDMEDAITAAERETLGRDLRATGKVRVTASDDIAAHVIGPSLGRFKRLYPGILLEIVARMDVVSLSRREADIALRGVRPTTGDVVVRPAGVWPYGLYASRDYCEAHGLRSGSFDLSRLSIITWTEPYAHLRGGPWFAKHARGAAIALRSDSARVHFAACKASAGVAILPSKVAERDPDLVCLLPSEQVLSLELLLVVHRDLLRTARIRAVMEFLADLSPKRS
jgi:DNA-binding transcriptional LysR family regulator